VGRFGGDAALEEFTELRWIHPRQPAQVRDLVSFLTASAETEKQSPPRARRCRLPRRALKRSSIAASRKPQGSASRA